MSPRRKAPGRVAAAPPPRPDLSRTLVCVSGLSRSEKDRIYASVEKLGGRWDSMLTEQTTLLISNGTPSSKSSAAVRLGIPVVFPAWMTALEAAVAASAHCDLQTLVESHRVPALFGCVVAVVAPSQVDEDAALERTISENGGRVSRSVDAQTTHVVVAVRDRAARSTAAVQAAQRRQIPVVTDAWVHQCIAQRGRVDESPFTFGDTPWLGTAAPLTAEETTDGSELQEAPAAVASRWQRAAPSPLQERLARLQKVSATALQGVAVVLGDGLPTDTLRMLKQLLNTGGATRLNSLEPRATHYAVLSEASVSPIEREALAAFPAIRVVPFEWLADSLEAGRPVDITAPAPPEPAQLTAAKQPLRRKGSVLALAADSFADAPSQMLLFSNSNAASAAVPTSQLPTLTTSQRPPPLQRRRTAGIEVEVNFADFFNPARAKRKPSAASIPADDAVEDTIDAFGASVSASGSMSAAASLLADGPSSNLFENHTFDFIDFSPENLADATLLARQFGAKVGSGGLKVVPFSSGASARGDVTDLWFEACVHEKRLIEPSEQPLLFRPPPCALPISAFRNLRFSVTGFGGTERHVWSRVVAGLGAVFTEGMDRTTTHLVARKETADQPPSKKLLKAESFGVTVVEPDWLLNCVAAGALVPVSDEVNPLPAAPQRALPTPTPTLPTPNVALPTPTPTPTPPPQVASLAPTETQTTSTQVPATQAGSALPLVGVALAVSDRLSHRRSDLHLVATALGATCHHRISPNCTHFVHEGRIKETFSGLQLAQRAKARVVHPSWLFAAQRLGVRPAEEAYPFHLNPQRALPEDNFELDLSSSQSASQVLFPPAAAAAASASASTSVSALASAPAAKAPSSGGAFRSVMSDTSRDAPSREMLSKLLPPSPPPPVLEPEPALDDEELLLDRKLNAALKRRRVTTSAAMTAAAAAMSAPSAAAASSADEDTQDADEVGYADTDGKRRRARLLRRLTSGSKDSNSASAAAPTGRAASQGASASQGSQAATGAGPDPQEAHFMLTSMSVSTKDAMKTGTRHRFFCLPCLHPLQRSKSSRDA